jgi:hypothetical protein
VDGVSRLTEYFVAWLPAFSESKHNGKRSIGHVAADGTLVQCPKEVVGERLIGSRYGRRKRPVIEPSVMEPPINGIAANG